MKSNQQTATNGRDFFRCAMKDNDRIKEALDEGWIGETGLRQVVRRLVKDTRDDERSACAEIARQNESFKSVEEIERRATEQA